jgi:ABC-type antimicrobial peptide transport system permease subunit
MALGAERHDVLRLVLREGAVLVGIGVLAGIPGMYAVAGLIRGMLVDVSTSDPLTLGAVALGFVVVTMAVCYVPARRVLTIQPAQLLARQERGTSLLRRQSV